MAAYFASGHTSALDDLSTIATRVITDEVDIHNFGNMGTYLTEHAMQRNIKSRIITQE